MSPPELPRSTSPYDYLPVKYPPLSPPDLDRFLKGRWIAQLATVSNDGSPHVKPVWFKWDGQKVWMITWLKCKTVSNLEHDDRVSISIDSSSTPVTKFPSMGCLIHGKAELVREVKNKVEPSSWHFKIFAKYLGEKSCYRPPSSLHLSNPNMAIGVKPARILSWDYRKAPKE